LVGAGISRRLVNNTAAIRFRRQKHPRVDQNQRKSLDSESKIFCARLPMRKNSAPRGRSWCVLHCNNEGGAAVPAQPRALPRKITRRRGVSWAPLAIPRPVYSCCCGSL